MIDLTVLEDLPDNQCLNCRTWKRRGCELIGICSHPESGLNAEHPSNSETRKILHDAGEDFRRFFWSHESYWCKLWQAQLPTIGPALREVWGKWPGDEKIGDILEALKEASPKAV